MVTFAEKLSPSEEFLVLAIKDTRIDAEVRRCAALYRELGDEVAWECATRNKVPSMVAHALIDAIGHDLPPRWRQVHDEVAAKTSAFVAELDRVSAALESRAIPVVGIESGGVAMALEVCRGCFISNDIEVLVRGRDLERVHDVLSSEGFVKTRRDGRASDDPGRPDAADRGWSVYRKELPGGFTFWLNVMWVAVLRRWYPLHGELDVEEMILRSVAVTGRRTGIRRLSSEDFLLSCACHTASHSYVREPGLRLHLDVDRIVRQLPIDWETVVQRSRARHIRHLIFPSLAIPKGLFATSIPDAVLAALVPDEGTRRSILSRLAAASVFNRGRPKFGRVNFLAFETLLCDQGRLAALRMALFPPLDWMRRGYGFTGRLPLPYFYAKRLLDLARRRAV